MERTSIYSWCSPCFTGDTLSRLTGDAQLAMPSNADTRTRPVFRQKAFEGGYRPDMDPKNIRALCGRWEETGRQKEIPNATDAALLANVRKDLNGGEKSSEGFVELVFLLPVLCASPKTWIVQCKVHRQTRHRYCSEAGLLQICFAASTLDIGAMDGTTPTEWASKLPAKSWHSCSELTCAKGSRSPPNLAF